MPDKVIYITHPEVIIDPAIPVPQWTLSALGAEARMRLFSRDPMLAAAKSIWCSTQTKAQVGARILSEALNLPVIELEALGENDRIFHRLCRAAAFLGAGGRLLLKPG